MTAIKPMLAGKCENPETDLTWPVLCTPKLDGIRCLIGPDGIARSRTWKPISNPHVQARLDKLECPGLDGELMLPGCKTTFGEASDGTGALMRKSGKPEFEYHVFDVWNSDESYETRVELMLARVAGLPGFVKPIVPALIETHDQLQVFESELLAQGYEGVILRAPHSAYKHGRSRLSDGGLLKLKRFVDSEAEVLGIEELMHNANKAEKDAFGRTKRSSHQANKVGLDTLGAFKVRDVHSGIKFAIGTGLDAEQRKWVWEHESEVIGKVIRYRYQSVGMKDKPRFPSFKGFRDEIDFSVGD